MSDWADQVENEEATHGALANNSDFPSLEAAKDKGKGKKKAKPVKLQDFLLATLGKADFADKSLQDKQIRLNLPTASRGGPREDGDGRPPGGLGGGFRDYGGDREGRGGRFQREDRPPREEREPSRADTVDDWGSTRKFVPGGDGGGFGGGSRGFGGGFGDRDRPPREARAPSNADLVDDWGSTRKFEPSGPSGSRGGFEDRRGPDRRYDGPGPLSKADLEDSWGRGRDFKPVEPAPQSRGFSGSRDTPRESSAADREERWGRRAPAESVNASAAPEGPSERPRLKLAPRSAPAAEQGAAAPAGATEERKPSSNPFGAARPREEVLREKGVDPVKEALKLEHGEVIRDESPAEKALKTEVDALAKQLAELKTAAPSEGGEVGGPTVSELEQQLDAKELALLKLQAEEDDRVRFARGGRQEERQGKERPSRRQDAESPAGAKDGGAPPPRKDRW